MIDRGEFVTLIGHSGCGKSTLLNIIAGFEQASAGGVILDGKEITMPGLDRKEEDPKGDRVVVTYSGKFLPYKKW